MKTMQIAVMALAMLTASVTTTPAREIHIAAIVQLLPYPEGSPGIVGAHEKENLIALAIAAQVDKELVAYMLVNNKVTLIKARRVTAQVIDVEHDEENQPTFVRVRIVQGEFAGEELWTFAEAIK